MPDAVEFVSVVMPVRNAMPYLDAAIESILAQTHPDFELILGDDGSTDGSSECLAEWARRDSRIRLLRNDGDGLGPSGSANWVTRAARHRLIARMDADDVSMPDRLRVQVQTFQANPDAAVVGGLSDFLNARGRRVAGRDRSIFRNPRCVLPCSHGSLMFRREIFDRVGGYRQACDYWEDVDLFIRMEREGLVLILPEILYRYRFSPTSARQVSDEIMVSRALDFATRCLAAYSEGRDYEPLIREQAHTSPPGQIAPSALVPAALEKLWRGQARTIFSSWAWRNAASEPRPRLRTRIFFTWLWLNPTSLRAAFRLRARIADWRARKIVPDGTVHVWRNGALRRSRSAANAPAESEAESLADSGATLVAAGGARYHEPA